MSDDHEVRDLEPGERDFAPDVADFMTKLGARFVFAVVIMPDDTGAYCATTAADGEIAQRWLTHGASFLRMQADHVEALKRIRRVIMDVPEKPKS